MRERLMVAAVQVFGDPDSEPAVIDHVIRQAGVSRGSFYNYFKNSEELLRTVAVQTGNELMQAVAPVVESREDPVERVSAGVRSWMVLLNDYPHMPPFFRRAGLYLLEENTQIRRDMPRDVMAGMQSGQFTVAEIELGFVLVAGTVLAAINTLALGARPVDYGNKLAQHILMSLGVEAAEAERVSRLPLPEPKLSPIALIVRSVPRG